MNNEKRTTKNIILLCLSLFTFHFSLFTVSAQIAVKGETVWTMAGEPIQNGVVLINRGKIEAVGTANQVKIPAGYRILIAKTVTPGLIDAHSVVGLAGYMNQPNDQMQVENSSPMQPELRAMDAYNAEDRLIEWIRSFGVTTIHTGHAPAALTSGQTMIAKTFGKSVEDATITTTAMIAVTLGESGLASGGKSPGTVSKAAAMLRAELIKAQSYGTKPDSPRDLRAEMWKKVLTGEIRLLVTAHKARDIMTALRIAKEFNIKIVLDGASEALTVINEIKASGFPVIVHPTMYRAGGETESLSMETAAKLKQAGILVALQSGYETYVPKTRVVLFEAAIAASNGLSARDALATVTIDAAKILGIDNRVGSIEKGKDADLAMYDGDPFEYLTHCIGTIINGQVVSETIR
ncbi:MAG TPA: amidohydrolase family protein [Pyrinomonadaceae bacterium]|nr:amidohydrolase family protein [Pyrinomonadaceae bacterium]